MYPEQVDAWLTARAVELLEFVQSELTPTAPTHVRGALPRPTTADFEITLRALQIMASSRGEIVSVGRTAIAYPDGSRWEANAEAVA